MNAKLKKIYAYGLVAVATLFLSGCGGNQMMMEEQQMMMQSSIDAAMRKANTADYKAGIAKQVADEALDKVNMMYSRMKMRGMKDKMMK